MDEEEGFSEAFLAAHGDRVDAIGKWSPDPMEDGIVWREPDALRNDWVPFDLRFQVEAEDEAGSFDPDEEMFRLWELYRPRHADLVAKFRREAEEMFAPDPPSPFGKREVTRACVWVRRAGEPGDVYHALEVTFSVPWDEDHGYYAEYDETSDEFAEVSCS